VPLSAGFYKRRRGILEHLEAGRISLLDLAVHDYLNLKANLVIGNGFSIPAGVCITSANAIHATCPSQISERAVQRSLKHLQKIGWIKTWRVRGKRGNYPVIVCRASVHDLSGNEYRVNGEGTTDWRRPVYAAVGDLSSLASEADPKLSGDREVRSENREKTNTKGERLAPAAVSLEQETKDASFVVFWEKWPRRQAKAAARHAWMKIPISEYSSVMTGLEKYSTSDQWTRGVIPHPATWLNEKRWQDEDIPQFVGGANGANTHAVVGRKPTVNDNIEQTLATLRAAGQVRPN
jgi:hypothetical protein